MPTSRRAPDRRPVLAGLAILLAALAATPAAHAQSAWIDRSARRNVHFELARPPLDAFDAGFFTFAGFFTGRFPVGEQLAFVVELPLATVSIDESLFGDTSSMTVGNPYVGMESRPGEGSGAWFEFGVRPPVTDEDEFAYLVGMAADADRWEAFVPNRVVARAAGHWRDDPRDGGLGADVRIAPAVWIPTEDEGAETELFATYGAQFLVHSAQARGGVGIDGRWLATEDGDFGQRSTHQIGIAFDFLRGGVRPGVTLHIPLDDDGILVEAGDAVIGLTLNIVPH